MRGELHKMKAAGLLARHLEAATRSVKFSDVDGQARIIVDEIVKAAKEELLDELERNGITLREVTR